MTGTVVTGGSNGPLAAGGLFTPTVVKSAAYTANPGDFVPVDTSGGAVTITLPAAPADQAMVAVKLVKLATGNAVTVAAGGADVFDVQNGPTSKTLAALYQAVVLQYAAYLGAWYVFDQSGQTPGVSSIVNLTDGATIAVNAALGNDFRVTIAGNRTLSNPTSPTDGQKILVQVKQGAGGSHTLAYGTAYDWGTTGAPTLTTTAAAIDVLEFVYNAAAGKWLGLLAALGF